MISALAATAAMTDAQPFTFASQSTPEATPVTGIRAPIVDLTHFLEILGTGKYGIEGINNLAAVDRAGASVFVGAPSWVDSSGGPGKIIAFNRAR